MTLDGVVPDVGETNSQPVLDGVAVYESGVLSVLVREIAAGVADVLPYCAVKVRPAGLIFSSEVVATVRVTGICAEAPIPDAEMLMAPVQVCAVVSPVGLIVTIRVVGVELAKDVTCNQLPPQVEVEAVALMAVVVFGVVTETLCELTGLVPPIW